jgi:hypothetical protein
MYQFYVLYLAWWWLNEPKHVAEFLILITNICCVYWPIKLLYYVGLGSFLGQDSVDGKVTRNGLDGPRTESRWEGVGGMIFHTRPDRMLGPASFIYNAYRVILRA